MLVVLVAIGLGVSLAVVCPAVTLAGLLWSLWFDTFGKLSVAALLSGSASLLVHDADYVLVIESVLPALRCCTLLGSRKGT